MIYIFWYFILGIVFISFIYPICESVCGVALTYLEYLKGKFTIKITEMNLQIQKMNEPEIPPAHVIGFSIPTDEEYADDDI